MTSLSQFNEQETISRYFGSHVGSFIDIGAGGGVALSNTFALGLMGWHGLLVEASPFAFAQLVSNYVHRGGFQFVNAAFWVERRLMPFHLHPGFYSSLIHKDEPGLFMASYWVQTVTAADLKGLQPEADMISLDIEGADLHVFPSLADAYPKCRLWCVEHAKNEVLRIAWMEQFKNRGLRVLAATHENFIAVR